MDEITQIDSVPFGNSIHQIQHFIVGTESESRRRRNCLLQLNVKYNTLKECEFRRRRIEIDLIEIEEKKHYTTGFDLQRLEVDADEKQHGLSQEIKLIKDCLVEVAAYQKLLEDLPELTREEFEAAEPEHWRNKFLKSMHQELVSTGTISPGLIASLESVGVIISRNQENKLMETRIDSTAPTLADQLAKENNGNILPEVTNDNILRIDTTNHS